MMTGRYLEDFQQGETLTTDSRTITFEEILAFAELTGDTNPLHTDREFMRDSQFGDVIAHGLLVVSCAIGLIAATGMMLGTTIALSEVRARFLAPVRADDEIRVEIEITELRTSRKPDRGVLRRDVRVIRGDGEVSVQFETVNVMRRRPGGTPEG